MNCPKCGFEQTDNQEVCLHCGVIFAKLHAPPVLSPSDSVEAPVQVDSGFGGRMREVSALIPYEDNPFVRSARMLVWLGLAIWGVKFMFTPIKGEAFSESFMHLINLPFHEAGHIIFLPLVASFRCWAEPWDSC